MDEVKMKLQGEKSRYKNMEIAKGGILTVMSSV